MNRDLRRPKNPVPLSNISDQRIILAKHGENNNGNAKREILFHINTHNIKVPENKQTKILGTEFGHTIKLNYQKQGIQI